MTAMMTDGSTMGKLEAMSAAIAPFSNLTDVALGNIRRVYEALTPNRETLAVLFSLDAAQTDPTDQWITFFVETASSQLIWDERPTGTVSAADAAWVLARFDDAPSLAILAVLVLAAHASPATAQAMLHSLQIGPSAERINRPVPGGRGAPQQVVQGERAGRAAVAKGDRGRRPPWPCRVHRPRPVGAAAAAVGHGTPERSRLVHLGSAIVACQGTKVNGICPDSLHLE